MRIFSNPLDMIKEVERDLFEMGTTYQSKTVQDRDVSDNPDFQTVELWGYGYTLTRFEHEALKAMLEYGENPPNWEWVAHEIHERLHGLGGMAALNPGLAWLKNEEFWGRFIRNGVFSYSYAERWQEQLPYVIRELREKPESRQVILTMYDKHQDMMHWGGRDRVPCSLTYHFGIREGRLNLIYNQRSCDFIKFFKTDVWLTVQLLIHVANELEVEPGQFTHVLSSLHAFRGDLKGREVF